jgi:hypothetical protein
METGKVVAGVIMLILVSILIFNSANLSQIIQSLGAGTVNFARAVNTPGGATPTAARRG